MLKKLVKYDLIWINKSMVIFFIIGIIVSTLTRIVSCFDNTFVGNILYIVFKCASISCIVSIIINCSIRIWNRFRLNIYKDESYLTHTLPITKSTLYNSKMISSLLSMFISLFVVLICFIIVYVDNDMLDKLNDIFSHGNITFIFIGVLLLMILQLVYMTYCGIMGLILGHKFNNNKIIMTIVFGIGLYFLMQTVIFGITLGIGSVNSDIASLFTKTVKEDINFEIAVKSLVLIVNIVYIIFISTMYIVGKKLFKKGINVD